DVQGPFVTLGGVWRDRGLGTGGSRADRSLPASRPARPWRHGTRVPGAVRGRETGRGEGDPRGPGRGSRVPGAVRPRGRRGPPGKRPVHRSGTRRGRRWRGAVAGHGVRGRSLAGRGGDRRWADG